MESTSVPNRLGRIVFMGTPNFAVPTLLQLIDSGHKPLLVITQPDRPQGRRQILQPPPIKAIAIEHSIPVLQPERLNTPENISQILAISPDLIITVAYGEYLGKTLRETPQYGCINLHPSLLPKYRGASPVPFALFDGCTETGVTVFRMVKEMDAGPILFQQRVAILPEENGGELLGRLAEIGAGTVLETVSGLEQGRIEALPQDHSLATYTMKINKPDLELHWGQSGEVLTHRVRGLAPEPCAVTGFRGQRLKIHNLTLSERHSRELPGTVIEVVKNGGICVSTGDRDVMIHLVQPEGKRIMGAYEYHLGARIQTGERFHELV